MVFLINKIFHDYLTNPHGLEVESYTGVPLAILLELSSESDSQKVKDTSINAIKRLAELTSTELNRVSGYWFSHGGVASIDETLFPEVKTELLKIKECYKNPNFRLLNTQASTTISTPIVTAGNQRVEQVNGESSHNAPSSTKNGQNPQKEPSKKPALGIVLAKPLREEAFKYLLPKVHGFLYNTALFIPKLLFSPIYLFYRITFS